MITVQLAHTADVPRIIQIRHDAFSAHAPSAYSPTEVQTLLDDFRESEFVEMIDSRQLFVAQHDSGVVGVAGWHGEYLRHVYVDPSHARQRIASTLLETVESDFRQRSGRASIKAGVALHAEAFYLANGYCLHERAVAWDGSAYLEMTKQL